MPPVSDKDDEEIDERALSYFLGVTPIQADESRMGARPKENPVRKRRNQGDKGDKGDKEKQKKKRK
jgi:hypothetical protein